MDFSFGAWAGQAPLWRGRFAGRPEVHAPWLLHWTPGKVFVFDDTAVHEVRNDTDEERVVLLWHVDRPMKTPARLLHKLFVAALKKSSFFKNPQKNMATFEDRFEQATRDAAETLEKMSTDA